MEQYTEIINTISSNFEAIYSDPNLRNPDTDEFALELLKARAEMNKNGVVPDIMLLYYLFVEVDRHVVTYFSDMAPGARAEFYRWEREARLACATITYTLTSALLNDF